MDWWVIAIIVVLVLYVIGGVTFFFYVITNDSRRNRITGTRLFIALFASEGIGLIVCLIAWPFLWMLYPDDSQTEKQPPEYLGPDE